MSEEPSAAATTGTTTSSAATTPATSARRLAGAAPLSLLDCSNCPVQSTPICLSTWDFLATADNVTSLNLGHTLCAFECCVGANLSETLKTLIDGHINITSFPNEEKEGGGAPVDVRDKEQASKYTFIVTKVAYLLPGINLEDITPELFGRVQYHEACQPGQPLVWKDCTDPTTFRITKTVIPIVFKITIQMKAHTVSAANKTRLEQVEGRPLDMVICLERTKRNTAIADMTYKTKSFMAYNKVKGGLLVTHTTIVLNTIIPSYGTWILNNLSSFGSKESAQTAELTRQHLGGILSGKSSGSGSEEAKKAPLAKGRKKSWIRG